MEGPFTHTVYFESPDLLPNHRKAVERYFQNQRKSGGGESGALRQDEQGVYSIAFWNQKDQREVLKRKNHEVKIGNTSLKFTVREGQASPPLSLQTSGTTPMSSTRSSLPSSGECHQLEVDRYLLHYLKDCPKAGKWLDEQLAPLHSTVKLCPEDERVLVRRRSQRGATSSVDDWKTELCTLFKKTLKHQYSCYYETDCRRRKKLLESSGFQTEDDVKVYSETHVTVVVGETAQVEARLNALKEIEKASLKTRRIVKRFDEYKLRLLWRQLERTLQREFPKVKVTREKGGQLVLEGRAKDVLEADDFITEQDEMVMEKKLSYPRYLLFWKKAYGAPGMLSDYLGLNVEIEIQETGLRIFSFSTEILKETELALQREFVLKEFPITNLTEASLKEKVRPALQEINHDRCRVSVLFDNMLYVVGHAKEVEKLSEVVTKLILESTEMVQNRTYELLSCSTDICETSPTPKSPEPTQQCSYLSVDQEAEVIVRYCLSDELEVIVCLGDITKQEADALVNAANEDLKHVGGVASALSKAGGPEVQKESSDLVKNIGKICTGEVVVTSGGKLKCKQLLHAVGPVNGKAGGKERVLIQKTVTSALNLCEIMEFGSIVLPCISSGLSRVPIDMCAEAMVHAVRAFGSVRGRSLTKITLIDNRREVVQALKAQCDRLLQGTAAGDTDGAQSLELQTGAAAGSSRRNITVQLVQGTIENQQVEAVVSPMLHGDPLSTQVGNSLHKTVGRQLMDLYKKQDGGDMPGDSVLVEGLTGQAFKAVFFVHLPKWDNDPDGTAVEVLRLAVSNVLTSCENQGFTSVAFPVLGAGLLLRFPEDIVAQVLHEQISYFEQRRTSTTPFFVNIVYPTGFQMFEKIWSSIQESLKQPVTQESAAKRIILLGKTGSGKSSLGNTILGEKAAFKEDMSPNSGTKQCQSKTKTVHGRNITLIDTPGLFDTECPEEELKRKILSCITESSPGPHAFLIVLKVDKFSEQEQAIITKIQQYFSEEALQYATVVFTHGEQLEEGTDIKTFIQQNKGLSELVRKCGNRCHVVDNRHWNSDNPGQYRNNQFQVEELLKTIDEMVIANNWGFYTNKAFKAMEKDIEKEEASIKEDKGLVSKEELRNEAKKRVLDRWLISLAGIGTGALLGAVFGVEALVRLTITAVQNGAVLRGAQKLRSAIGFGVTADVALTTAGVATGTAALAGGIYGGVIGGKAADEAESVQEAVDRAKKAVMTVREQYQ